MSGRRYACWSALLGLIWVPTVGLARSLPSTIDPAGPGQKVSMVYLVQHTHTDIGYTRPQSEILPEHLRFIDEALECCDRTDSYPDDAKFRWTCESSWVVREYLDRRPADQVERFKRRVAEGRIEVTAMALNMSEIATESSLAASLQVIRELREKHGIPVRLAMQDDVNGAAWCLPDYFQSCGVKYLTMGINKTRSLLPFDMPTAFWWESPSGKRTLAFRAEHYNAANGMKLHEGDFRAFEAQLKGYLNSLAQKNYPLDRVSLQYSGFFADNSPPTAVSCDVIRKWNETHASPRLRSATASEFMDDVAGRYGDKLPVHRVAWPDWWTDGFGSAAMETAQSRAIHAGMQATQGLMAMVLLSGQGLRPGAAERIAGVQEQLLFYDEHTFGAAQSINDPASDDTIVQWNQKAAYVWEAAKQAGMLREEALGSLGGMLPTADGPTLVVFNTLNWRRSGVTRVFVDRLVAPPGSEVRFADAESGKAIPAQMIEKRGDGAYWAVWTTDVPSLGYRSYRISPGDAKAVGSVVPLAPKPVIEGAYYTMTLDPATGAVRSLVDKESGAELVDQGSPWQLGQLIYERHPGSRELRRDGFKRTTVRNVKLQPGVDGPIWKSIVIGADLEGCAVPDRVRVEVRLFKTAKRIELYFGLRKLPVTEPEGLYVAFPFQQPGGKVSYEAQGGTAEPGAGQLPGSSSDWHTVQNFIAVRSVAGQIICGSDEVPLVQFGDLNLGKWQPVARVEKLHVFSWVMNNYWFTNFKATQEGEFRWSYYLTSRQDGGHSEATRFGWGSRVPLVSRVLQQGEGGQGKPSGSLPGGDVPNLLLVESRPARDGRGVVFHWREVDGKPATLELGSQPFSSRAGSMDEVTVLESTVKAGISSLSFAPREVKFMKLSFR